MFILKFYIVTTYVEKGYWTTPQQTPLETNSQIYEVLQAYRDSDLNSRLTVKNNICFAGKVQSSVLPLQGYDCNSKLLNYAVCKIKGFSNRNLTFLLK